MYDILIVDDSKLQRGQVRQALRDTECTFREAENGRLGLEQILEKQPDCLVLDLMMPEMGGFELMRKLRDRGIVLPILVATSDTHDQTRRSCLDVGALDVIHKPLIESEVREAVNKVLRFDQVRTPDPETAPAKSQTAPTSQPLR